MLFAEHLLNMQGAQHMGISCHCVIFIRSFCVAYGQVRMCQVPQKYILSSQKFYSCRFYVIVKAQKSYHNKIKGFGIIIACLYLMTLQEVIQCRPGCSTLIATCSQTQLGAWPWSLWKVWPPEYQLLQLLALCRGNQGVCWASSLGDCKCRCSSFS